MLTAKTSTRSTALTFGNFGINLTFLVAPPSESSDTKWNISYLPGCSAPNSAKTFPVLSDNNDYCHLVVLTVFLFFFQVQLFQQRRRRQSVFVAVRSLTVFRCLSVFLSLKPLTDHLSFLPLAPHISSSVSVPFSILPFFPTAPPPSWDFSPL